MEDCRTATLPAQTPPMKSPLAAGASAISLWRNSLRLGMRAIRVGNGERPDQVRGSLVVLAVCLIQSPVFRAQVLAPLRRATA